MTATLTEDECARLTALRRDLHAHPELGFEEERTAGIVAGRLAAAGITVTRGLGRTGVVGTLTTGPGRAVALRADMDALAMPEIGTPPYASTVPGKMHACGHDGHTTMLLGAAERLARARDFSGTVHFVFQPAEEGRGGAKAMIADGFFEQFPVDAAYGLHNMPGLAVDRIAAVPGPQLASSDSWEVAFTGQGSHGAKPHQGRDAVTAAGHFLTQLATVTARRVDPLEPAVVSACAVSAGEFAALNVIPETVRVGGTARAYSAAVRDLLEEEIGRLAQGVAASFGIRADYGFRRRIPPVVNDAACTGVARAAIAKALGPEGVVTAFPPSTAGDDFAEFSTRVPGAYVWLGNGPAEEGALHHNGRYDFNDAAIPAGVRFWEEVVRAELAR
ncbi:amidohydrolase [Paroceanicella profunda]|uniref:Amidohydrolase n=1 Tax=Paroceanicella profunda TaxID=2579971 RepID=A0A5B8FSB6_9RHOB|nr:M20 aminoacylase family protein [Paroceanicella profunda]QDL91265.1 amidohydrolase [Paroceanicella profunda]